MTASVTVPPGADLEGIARAAGNGDFAARYYDLLAGTLTVQGVTQQALDAALAEIGPAASPEPEIHRLFAEGIAAGLPVAGRAGAVQLDPDSRRELATAVLMASLGAWPDGGFWRLSDNANLPLDAAQVTRLGVMAAAYYQALFSARSALLDAARAGQAVDPQAGWPELPAFDPAG